MTDPKLCCNQPPMIFSAENATGDRIRTIHSISCLTCGRCEIHTDKEQAIQKFNRSVRSEKPGELGGALRREVSARLAGVR